MTQTIVYGEMVKSLSKKGEDILKELSSHKCEMWHHASCIQGEGGEIFDTIKKHVIYNKPIDERMIADLIEELGDLEFYLEGLRQTLNITRQITLDHNATKLAKRYGKDFKYSNDAAQIRADKQPDPIPPKEYKTLS